MILVGYCKF